MRADPQTLNDAVDLAVREENLMRRFDLRDKTWTPDIQSHEQFPPLPRRPRPRPQFNHYLRSEERPPPTPPRVPQPLLQDNNFHNQPPPTPPRLHQHLDNNTLSQSGSDRAYRPPPHHDTRNITAMDVDWVRGPSRCRRCHAYHAKRTPCPQSINVVQHPLSF